MLVGAGPPLMHLEGRVVMSPAPINIFKSLLKMSYIIKNAKS